MSVTNSINKTLQDGNGIQTTFEFSFNILKDTDLKVYKVNKETGEIGNLLELNRDYIVTINKIGEGGSVTYTVPPTETEQAGIQRIVDITQPMDIQIDTEYAEKTMNNAFDKGCMIDQQLQEQIDRSFKLPFSFTSNTFDVVLSNIQPGKAIKINNTGDGLDVTEENADTIIDTTKGYRDEAEGFRDNALSYKNSAESARDAILNNAGFIAVANDLTGNNNIGTVKNNLPAINNVSTNMDTVNSVKNNLTAINNVNTNMSAVTNVNTYRNIISNVNDNIGIINNVNDNISIIDNVNGSLLAVNTVSEHIEDIVEVKDTYYSIIDGNDNTDSVDGGAANSVYNAQDILDGNGRPLINQIMEDVKTNTSSIEINKNNIASLQSKINNNVIKIQNLEIALNDVSDTIQGIEANKTAIENIYEEAIDGNDSTGLINGGYADPSIQFYSVIATLDGNSTSLLNTAFEQIRTLRTQLSDAVISITESITLLRNKIDGGYTV